MISLKKRFFAELIGTFFLVFIGTGAAVITLMISQGSTPPNSFNIGIGMGCLGDGLLVWLLVLQWQFHSIIGHISGCHKSEKDHCPMGNQEIPETRSYLI